MTPFFSYARRMPFNGRVPITAAFDDVLEAMVQRSGPSVASSRAIPFDVSEQGNDYVVAAELPGFQKEDIAVEIDGARVTITAESKPESDDKGKGSDRILYTERRAGRVTRSFELAAEIDQEKASARYTNGVLVLTLPKKLVESRKLLTVQ